MTRGDELLRGSPERLAEALEASELQFHGGRIGGAFPRILR
jgi:hypothetical protein